MMLIILTLTFLHYYYALIMLMVFLIDLKNASKVWSCYNNSKIKLQVAKVYLVPETCSISRNIWIFLLNVIYGILAILSVEQWLRTRSIYKNISYNRIRRQIRELLLISWFRLKTFLINGFSTIIQQYCPMETYNRTKMVHLEYLMMPMMTNLFTMTI